MELTTKLLRQFVGGQMEFQTRDHGVPLIHCGQIKAIKITGRGDRAQLEIQFDWRAKGEGFPRAIKRWVKITPTPYKVLVADRIVAAVGNSRIAIQPLVGSERVLLCPKDDDLLDPSEVHGM